MPRIVIATIAVLAVCGCATVGDVPHSTKGDDARHGAAIARARCAGCHTIKGTVASPLHQAPTFAQIETRHSRRSLLWELEAINDVGHYEMPTTFLSSGEMGSLVAYIHQGRGR